MPAAVAVRDYDGICFEELNKSGRSMARMLTSCNQASGRIYV
jgi:hypothetical protein